MKNIKLKNWLWLIVIASLLTILDSRGYFNWLKKPVGQLVNPVKHTLYLNKVTEGSINQVEVGQLAMVEAELNKKIKENEHLRKLLGTKLPPSWQFVPANILSLNGYQMTIDMGQAMAIEKEMMVMALVDDKINGGVLVGKVDKVDLMKSTVGLLSAKEVMIKARTETGATGLIKEEKGELRLTEVLQEQTISSGELVLTQGTDGWLPGLVVGRVGEVSKVDTEVYQSASVDPIIEANSLRQVFVVSL